MWADNLMLRAKRVAILGQFLETIPDQEDRASFIMRLRDSRAISPSAAATLSEIYLEEVSE